MTTNEEFYTERYKLAIYGDNDPQPYVLPKDFEMTPEWSEITSIENLAFYKNFLLQTKAIPDWRFLRGWIKELVYNKISSDWSKASELSLGELRIACEYLPNSVPAEILTKTLSSYEILECSKNFNDLSRQSRESRLRRAEEHAFVNWTVGSCLWIVNEIYKQNLTQMYITGIEKMSADGYFGIWDWLENLKSNSSLETLITPTNGIPRTQIIEEIQNILIYGVV